jgi:hypothetical protein
MVKIKEGVTFVYSIGGFLILQAIKENSRMLGKDLTITSGADGLHNGINDPHHFGNAYDVRSHDLDEVNKQQFLANQNSLLSREKFFYFLEDTGTDNEHFHTQVKNGTKFTIQDYFSE